MVALRDRALIGTMLYTFGRVGAVVSMNLRRRMPESECYTCGKKAENGIVCQPIISSER